MQLVEQQCAQCTWKALALLPTYLPGSWKARHATTSQAFPSSPTTFSTTFAAERRPGGYSSSVDLWEIRRQQHYSLLLSPILWPLSLGFSHNFPCQLFFFSLLSPMAWAAQPLQQWCLYLLRGLESTKSCSITRNTLPSAWSPTQFRSGKDFLGHVVGDLKGSPAVQGYPSPMLPISMDIFRWKDLISVKQKEDKEKRLNERCSHWDKAVSAQPG